MFDSQLFSEHARILEIDDPVIVPPFSQEGNGSKLEARFAAMSLTDFMSSGPRPTAKQGEGCSPCHCGHRVYTSLLWPAWSVLRPFSYIGLSSDL